MGRGYVTISTLNYTLTTTINYKLYIGRSGSAVGLSAISLLAPLAKDAAPIPNALEATNSKSLAETQIYILSQRRKGTQRRVNVCSFLWLH